MAVGEPKFIQNFWYSDLPLRSGSDRRGDENSEPVSMVVRLVATIACNSPVPYAMESGLLTLGRRMGERVSTSTSVNLTLSLTWGNCGVERAQRLPRSTTQLPRSDDPTEMRLNARRPTNP